MPPERLVEVTTAEERRLAESRDRTKHWKRWGPYVSERAWGTVREDYSAQGTAWEYFPHDHARSRAYRWNEDGIAGICDRHQVLCFAIALWNGKDPILKERLFGLTGSEGNHGEDVKEHYYYLDSTPTHSYMRYLYKYPQVAFPYDRLVEENGRRSKREGEFELLETGVFDDDRYFDVFVEYAKADIDDILVRIEVVNRGPAEASLDVLPTLWFRNTWSWGDRETKPILRDESDGASCAVRALHERDGEYVLECDGSPALLFTDNETNAERLYRTPNASAYVKDGIDDCVVRGLANAVNPARVGTKCAARYSLRIAAGQASVIQLRLRRPSAHSQPVFGALFDGIFTERKFEADAFYEKIIPLELSADAKNVMRQSLGGLLWSKQFYHYVVGHWLEGDPTQPPPPLQRRAGRNADWHHLYNADVCSMPDKWEYPWYAAWDLAFHCVPLAIVDSEFAKEQLILLLREWYMHPNGQLPAYEWALDDVNPPVHAWAALRVYKIERKRRGVGDRKFLERVFHKLMLNFTWWVNRKDTEGKNVFQGGFLGLDNIGVFDRSKPLPTGGHMEQSDGTSWMAMYCLNMLAIALELADGDDVYEDVASKFWEHFVHISHAMNTLGLWDEGDGFYYDILHTDDGQRIPLKTRSMVGLIPLFAVETLRPEVLAKLPDFKRRLEWFIDNRPDLTSAVCSRKEGVGNRRLLAIVDQARIKRILRLMLDENEFLSPFGIRSVSKHHAKNPYVLRVDGKEHRVDYEPGESSSGLFGGNSNWRGPIWFPLNYLLIESLQKFHHYWGDEFKVEFPTGSGREISLADVASELSRRLSSLFLKDAQGKRPAFRRYPKLEDPHFRDWLLFYEYFHGEDGSGAGASHQTGWTGLVSKLLQQSGE